MSTNGGRSGGSMVAGFSIESVRYPEDKCRGVIMDPISLEISRITTIASDACLIILKM